jgi:hypothetical protein
LAPSASFVVSAPGDATIHLPPTPTELRELTVGRGYQGATLTLILDVDDHPLGPCVRRYDFVDGRIAGDHMHISGAPTIHLRLRFAQASSFLIGGAPFRDVATGAVVAGDLLALGCLVGLLAPPGVHGHEGRHRAVKRAETAIEATSRLRPWLASLQAETTVP